MRHLLLIALCLLGGCNGGTLESHAPSLNVGRAALDSGAPDIALRVSADQLRRSPSNIAALLLQADALAAQGQSSSAEATYRQVLARQPNSVPAKLGLGRLVLTTDPPAAELLFLEILAQDPRNAIALNNLGIARDLQDRHTQAQAAYRQALGVAPEMQAATVNLALSLALSGQAEQARNLLRPLATAPDASTRLRHNYALVAEVAGDRSEAERTLGSDMSAEDLRAALQSYDALPGRRRQDQ